MNDCSQVNNYKFFFHYEVGIFIFRRLHSTIISHVTRSKNLSFVKI